MSYGIYIHFPFCLQQCPYCDFATVINDDTKHAHYLELLKKEIQTSHYLAPSSTPSTLYLGGGTPSLMDPQFILDLLREFEKHGIDCTKLSEFTIEINPGTLSKERLKNYLDLGINRFSVGAQSFNNELLKKIGRKHSSLDTINTLELLNAESLNYSFDLLFSLPGQTMDDLEQDLLQIKKFLPPHISTYYLTIPQKHSLNKNRPSEDTDLAMFDLVEERLREMAYTQYEISNYCQAGRHSIHNKNAWLGEYFWGLGMSAHSYLPAGDFGARTWNPKSIPAYQNKLNKMPESKNVFFQNLEDSSGEILSELDLLNDKVHTSLRIQEGLSLNHLALQFSMLRINSLKEKLDFLVNDGFLMKNNGSYALTKKGRRLNNLVLEKLFIA